MMDALAEKKAIDLHRTPAGSQMLWIPGGTFRMGSDRHYPEEAPVHRVAVDGFWMDRTPVTNRQFRDFVREQQWKARVTRMLLIHADALGFAGAAGRALSYAFLVPVPEHVDSIAPRCRRPGTRGLLRATSTAVRRRRPPFLTATPERS
jgi:formylglycine-generating enzyme required for sulfatase activity